MSKPGSRVEKLLAANEEFAKSFTPPPTMQQLQASTDERVFVVTCMDPRVVPEAFLGPQARIAVFRNAGGRCTPDTVRSITVLRSLSRRVKEMTVMVVHHTDCGATHLTAEQIREDIKARNPENQDSVKDLDFGLFTAEDLDKVVLEDARVLKAHDLLQGVRVRGFVLETETGLLRELEV